MLLASEDIKQKQNERTKAIYTTIFGFMGVHDTAAAAVSSSESPQNCFGRLFLFSPPSVLHLILSLFH